MKKILTIVALSTVSLFACKSHKTAAVKVPGMSATDVERGSELFPGLTLAGLEKGKSINEQFCNTCHALKDHTLLSQERLEKIVPAMVGKVNKKTGETSINEEDATALLQYLITMGPASK
ncbi:MAG: hypothetical protein KDD36_11000 [Flavobacteriales bacterium]|nr:hypothetical protein [Flavobacteriales bacterium]